MEAAEKTEQLARGESPVQTGRARNETQPAARVAGRRSHVEAGDGRMAGARREQPRQNPQCGRFARAVGTDQAVDLTGLDLEREPLEGNHVAELFVEITRGKDGHEGDKTSMSAQPLVIL